MTPRRHCRRCLRASPSGRRKLLLTDRRWLLAFGAETAGWLMYVAALRLAPLSLVQAVAASGVAVLALNTQARLSSSSAVSRLTRSVPKPARFRPAAAN